MYDVIWGVRQDSLDWLSVYHPVPILTPSQLQRQVFVERSQSISVSQSTSIAQHISRLAIQLDGQSACQSVCLSINQLVSHTVRLSFLFEDI